MGSGQIICQWWPAARSGRWSHLDPLPWRRLEVVTALKKVRPNASAVTLAVGKNGDIVRYSSLIDMNSNSCCCKTGLSQLWWPIWWGAGAGSRGGCVPGCSISKQSVFTCQFWIVLNSFECSVQPSGFSTNRFCLLCRSLQPIALDYLYIYIIGAQICKGMKLSLGFGHLKVNADWCQLQF